jgi:LysR family transcriptional regulator, glycine cleavage system transcriptional activator
VKRRLAHLNALRAFEATARLGSYVRAAGELGVTPAAVGQHVRLLEGQFGSVLFERQGKKLAPTEAARAVLPDIKDAFDRLAHAAERLRESRRPPGVTVTLPPSFAAKWLIPRIESFRMAHPDVDVRLDTTDRLADLAREHIAVGIRYGAGRYPGLEATLLMEEDVFPVCSPALLTRVRKLRTPDDLAHFRLIHDTTMESHASFPSWTTWLRRAGASKVDARRGLRINSSIMALQAAIEGQGVALARSVIAAGDLEEGRVIRPLQPSCPTGYAYYLVYPAGLPLSRSASAFCHWLKQEAHARSVSSPAITAGRYSE